MSAPDPFDNIKTVPFKAVKEARQEQAKAEQPKAPRFELIRADSLEYRDPEWLLDGLIETETLSQIFGDPRCGKSFVAIDVACCVAKGRPFHGRDVRQGAVIYLAGEGHNGIKRRLVAWEKHTGETLADAPLYFSKVAAQFLDAASAEAVTQAVDAIAESIGDLRLIVVDTLARNFGPGDENSTQDMTRFVAALDALKARYGAALLVVHHTGHGDKQRSRGSMAMLGALDHDFRVEKDESTVTVTCNKMKDGPEPAPFAFTLDSVTVGIRKDGEPVTSAALTATEAPARKPKRLTPAQEIGMRSFDRARRAAGHVHDIGAAIHLDDWREHFYEMSTADGTEAKKKSFQRVRNDLVALKRLVVENDQYRLASPIDAG